MGASALCVRIEPCTVTYQSKSGLKMGRLPQRLAMFAPQCNHCDAEPTYMCFVGDHLGYQACNAHKQAAVHDADAYMTSVGQVPMWVVYHDMPDVDAVLRALAHVPLQVQRSDGRVEEGWQSSYSMWNVVCHKPTTSWSVPMHKDGLTKQVPVTTLVNTGDNASRLSGGVLTGLVAALDLLNARFVQSQCQQVRLHQTLQTAQTAQAPCLPQAHHYGLQVRLETPRLPAA